MKTIPLLGTKLTDQTPESFHAYTKSLEKPWKPKAETKTKTRKKKSDDSNAKLQPNAAFAETEKNAGGLDEARWQDPSGNQFFLSITD